MNDNNKTKQQLIKELEAMRQRVTGLEKSEAGYKQKVEVLQKSEEYFRAITQNSSDIIIDSTLKETVSLLIGDP